MNKKSFLGAIIFAIFLYLLLYNYILCPEVDFYDFHVWECEQCHAENLTFALCSGFCYSPQQSDLEDGGCPAIHPLEDCAKTVPHGSLTGQRTCGMP